MDMYVVGVLSYVVVAVVVSFLVWWIVRRVRHNRAKGGT